MTIEVDGLVVDEERWTVTLDGYPVRLSKKPMELLLKLASDPDRTWRYEELLREVWGYQSIPSTRPGSVAVCVSHLKRALGGRFIENVRDVGFRLRRAA